VVVVRPLYDRDCCELLPFVIFVIVFVKANDIDQHGAYSAPAAPAAPGYSCLRRVSLAYTALQCESVLTSTMLSSKCWRAEFGRRSLSGLLAAR